MNYGDTQDANAGTRRQTQIEEQNEALDKAIYRLSEFADRLEQRLSQVTRQEDLASAPCANEACLVPLAEALRYHSRRVDSVADRLDSLFLRIEL